MFVKPHIALYLKKGSFSLRKLHLKHWQTDTSLKTNRTKLFPFFHDPNEETEKDSKRGLTRPGGLGPRPDAQGLRPPSEHVREAGKGREGCFRRQFRNSGSRVHKRRTTLGGKSPWRSSRDAAKGRFSPRNRDYPCFGTNISRGPLPMFPSMEISLSS